MDQQSYNGWTNHATWLVNLWLTNDEYTEKGIRMAIRYGGHEGLKDYVDELLDESDIASGTLWYDLITSCLADVDWREIASYYVHDGDDEEDDNAYADEDQREIAGYYQDDETETDGEGDATQG